MTTSVDGHLKIVAHQTKDGHPQTLAWSLSQTQGWSLTRRECTTDMELGKYTLLKKLRPRSFDDEFPVTFGAMGVEGGKGINKKLNGSNSKKQY